MNSNHIYAPIAQQRVEEMRGRAIAIPVADFAPILSLLSAVAILVALAGPSI